MKTPDRIKYKGAEYIKVAEDTKTYTRNGPNTCPPGEKWNAREKICEINKRWKTPGPKKVRPKG